MGDFDVDAVRKQFPALAEGAAHFDGPGGSQTPQAVADAVARTMVSALANRGQLTVAERRADEIVVGARQAMADLLGTDPGGIVYGRSMTQLTYDFSRTLAKNWGPGDEVIVTRLDHDANVRPWVQAAGAVGATVRWLSFDPATSELDDIQPLLSAQTRLVAVTGASNLLGTRPDLESIAVKVHAAGALLYVDGVHLTAHAPVDAAFADFYACSPYKFFGPHCGVLSASPALLEGLRPDKLLPASDVVPERFEFGTLPYELLAGTTAAVDFIAGLGGTGATRRERLLGSLALLENYEDELRAELEPRLAAIDGVTLHGKAQRRTPTLLFSVDGWEPRAVAAELAEAGVNAPAGTFYALETARHAGLGDTGAVRAGLAPYTDRTDVDRLVEAVERLGS
ncbi:cysteine desulfurase family protein (TIGR01976 family) [Kribbella orskensis]|uniref:Cysteine desulfurase family protein (TIGR01976 family) n=1 Tax=Kribbella orskensis TaxID=2512216 RepID=A0ABY2BP00_9ACTN|nr:MULTISPECIES: cysteine desulfurase-like protein [Kribbella]TCN41996.1 cysteine desulfurase family protein (TIGR01976 family) [Kribbella sp. VKM Ac-2500]TCO25874.1 cysteine desulfurase family protein (TIGR01976 family) [Kribbella orskensis]